MRARLSTADRRRLENLFERASGLLPAEHAAFVERECGANAALRDELARLLAGHEGEDLLTRLQPGAPLRPGTRIGSYELLERIGEGGMGEVYAAEQLEPVVRRVALKLIKPGLDSAQVVRRFEAERQALARMTHPNVAHVYGGGATGDGRPYFAMEYVAGDPITDYCDRHRLSTRERLELFLGVCEGVQHAHQKGLIHRDLKPSNLLVTRRDGRAVPKVIDFGVARATTGRLAGRTLHTQVGQIVGTLDYMSPEQADPTGVDVDTRSDVYSLGVVLYQLVSGCLPFEHESALELSLSEIQRAIREQSPPTPSTRLRRQTDTATAVAPLHGTDERSLIRQLAGDLDWICLKALEKDPARRYPSVSELAADVQRHLGDEPVLAGKPGVLYRAHKFVRRNRVAVAGGLLVTVGVVAGLGGILSGRIAARAADRLARAERPYADAHRLRKLELRADRELWPPHPEKIAELETWLLDARALTLGLPDHRASLLEVRQRALPPEAAPPVTWSFETAEDQSRHDSLTALVAGLEELTHAGTGLLGTDSDAASPAHGWSVPRRLAFARELEAGFAEGGEYARAWGAVLPRIQAAYPSRVWQPQMGLVPIGMDPDPESGLWEFAHLMTGEPAVRGADGELVLTEETGVVLVLIRSGPFAMGAQRDDPTGNYDPSAGIDVESVHEVALSAFFLSKYELTQGQWKRLTGDNPSGYGPDSEWSDEWLASGAAASLLHPVEQVSWEDCMTWLPRTGLTLPSEAQWECGTRAGTKTAYWPGPDPADLQGAANVADAYGKGHGNEAWGGWSRDLDDGSTKHSPIGSYRPNAFGLHDVHGNVFEWCLDGYDANFYQTSPLVDPVAPGAGATPRVYRGGSFRTPALSARSSIRHYYPPGMAGHALGVRPAGG